MGMFSSIGNAVGGIAGSLLGGGGSGSNFINAGSSAFGDLSKPIADGISKGLTPVINSLGQHIGQNIGMIGNALSPAIASLGTSLTTGMQNAFKDAKAQNLAKLPTINRPDYPGFSSLLNGQNQLPGNLQLQGNTEALNQIRNTATSAGPSAWAQMRLGELESQAPGQMSALNRNNQGALKQARMGLMSEGGLSSGMYNKLGKDAGLQGMLARQDLRRQTEQNRSDLLMSDAQNKQSMLQSLPGLELDSLKPQQYNIQNILAENQAKNSASLQRYQQDMAGWAAQNTGKAIAQSGKK